MNSGDVTREGATVVKLKPREDFPKVKKFLEEVIQRSKVPGISVAMDVNGVTLEAAAGVSDARTGHPMTPETHFELGCINKFLTAIVVLELVNEGKIGLDQVISHYLPEMKGPNGDIIKVRHLLSHTAGYQGENMADPDIQQDYSYEEFAASFNQRRMHFEPGTVFDYSHSSSVILGRIVQSASGRSIESMVAEKIFKPLGIKPLMHECTNQSKLVTGHRLYPSTAELMIPFTVDWCDFWKGSLSGPWMRIQDLVMLARALMDDRMFSSQTKELLLSNEITRPGMFVGKRAENPFFVFGLGCARFPHGAHGVRSNSAGQSIALLFDPTRKNIVVAVGINADATNLRDICINRIFNSLLPEDANISPELFPLPRLPGDIRHIEGFYQGPGGMAFTIECDKSKLEMVFEKNPALSLGGRILKTEITVNEQGEACILPINGVSVGFFEFNHTNSQGVIVGDQSFLKLRRASHNEKREIWKPGPLVTGDR